MKKKILYFIGAFAAAGIAVVFSYCTSVDFVPDTGMPSGAYVLLMPEPVERTISLGIVSFKWHDGGERIVFAADSPHTEYFLFGAARRNYKLKLMLPHGTEVCEHESVFTPVEVSCVTLSTDGMRIQRK